MSMNESVYLIGQISVKNVETYVWRLRVKARFRGDERIQLIDPCSNGFNQNLMKAQPEKHELLKTKGIPLLVPKDKSYVKRSTMALANLNLYDPNKPMIGTFFELAWYLDEPEKAVIGIYDGDPEKDFTCHHPFVYEAVDVWTRNDEEACNLLEHYFLQPRMYE